METEALKFDDIITIENLFQAWSAFKREKRNKSDVQKFERHLEDNLFELYYELKNKTYEHGNYQAFYVVDPKRRHIHKSNVKDRVLHHLLYTYLYTLFDKHFIFDSYSCRKGKSTHKAIQRLVSLTRKLSKNYTGVCWSLKCDIEKFFASVDHQILKEIIVGRVKDQDIGWLLNTVIDSFYSELGPDKGIPLGNLTSQIFSNMYLNFLDHFVKHTLKVKYYLRYADDFLILTKDNKQYNDLVVRINEFLKEKLKLKLHPKKIHTRKFSWGIDFCGYIILPHYILPRTRTKKRILNKIGPNSSNQSLQAYLGYFSHASTYKISENLKNKLFIEK